jgi:hypothetical protein
MAKAIWTEGAEVSGLRIIHWQQRTQPPLREMIRRTYRGSIICA